MKITTFQNMFVYCAFKRCHKKAVITIKLTPEEVSQIKDCVMYGFREIEYTDVCERHFNLLRKREKLTMENLIFESL